MSSVFLLYYCDRITDSNLREGDWFQLQVSEGYSIIPAGSTQAGKLWGWETTSPHHGLLESQKPPPVSHFLQYASPPNPSNPIKQFHSLVTKHPNRRLWPHSHSNHYTGGGRAYRSNAFCLLPWSKIILYQESSWQKEHLFQYNHHLEELLSITL